MTPRGRGLFREAAVLRDARRSYDKRTRVPKELAQREAELSTRGYQAWAKARASNDFDAYAPILKDWAGTTWPG